jgi:hypothetical protein
MRPSKTLREAGKESIKSIGFPVAGHYNGENQMFRSF